MNEQMGANSLNTNVNRPSRKGRVKLGQIVITRAQFLLDRDYRSAELAFELHVPDSDRWRIREWCRRGAPHQRDATGHLIFSGQAFRTWVQQMTAKRPKRQAAEGQMWCCSCNTLQVGTDPQIVTRGERAMRLATCPEGHRMTQWARRTHS